MTNNDKQFDNYVVFFSGNVVEAHGYGFRSTVVSGEHSRSKTSAIIAMYDVSTTRVFVRYKTGGQKRWSTVVSGEHSRSKTSAIIAMYNVLTTRVFIRYKTVLYLTKTLVVRTSYIAIIALVLLCECSPLTTVLQWCMAVKCVIMAALSYTKGTGLSTILSHGGRSRSCMYTITESEQLNHTKRAA